MITMQPLDYLRALRHRCSKYITWVESDVMPRWFRDAVDDYDQYSVSHCFGTIVTYKDPATYPPLPKNGMDSEYTFFTIAEKIVSLKGARLLFGGPSNIGVDEYDATDCLVCLKQILVNIDKLIAEHTQTDDAPLKPEHNVDFSQPLFFNKQYGDDRMPWGETVLWDAAHKAVQHRRNGHTWMWDTLEEAAEYLTNDRDESLANQAPAEYEITVKATSATPLSRVQRLHMEKEIRFAVGNAMNIDAGTVALGSKITTGQ